MEASAPSAVVGTTDVRWIVSGVCHVPSRGWVSATGSSVSTTDTSAGGASLWFTGAKASGETKLFKGVAVGDGSVFGSTARWIGETIGAAEIAGGSSNDAVSGAKALAG